MNTAPPIRVLLADDHPLVLEGLEARLQNEPNIQVVGLAHDGQDALNQAARLNPDVVLIDISMPIMTGLEATPLFREQLPDVKVLVLSMHVNPRYIVQVMQSGASGYILKEVSSEEMVKAIETVHLGGTCFSSGASQSLFSGQPNSSSEPTTATPSIDHGLTQREVTVLVLLA